MGYGWTKRRDEQHKPSKAFSKAQKVYGQRMTEAPVNPKDQNAVTTDFDQLLDIRKANARRKAISNHLFMFFLAIITIIFFVWMALAFGA